MTIHDIIIDGFGRHTGLRITLSDGVNVICGENESGKSTVAAFIRAMLYGLSGRGAQSERKKYMPWKSGVKYGGELTFEHKGVLYRITACFGESKREDKILLYNDTSGEIIPVEANKTIGEAVLEIPLETYDLSVYAAQLSSKPDFDNGNMDYLFDQLIKKSDSMKQTSSDIIVGKRLKNAMESISSQRNERGILDHLQSRKNDTDASLKKIYDMETQAETFREEHMRLKAELSDIKEKHTLTKKNVDQLANAAQTAKLHKKIKESISAINSCDEELTEASYKNHKMRKPVIIVFALLILLCAACAVIIIFSDSLSGLSILQGNVIFEKMTANKILTYICLAFAAIILCIAFLFITSMMGAKEKSYKEELFELEEELCDILEIEYLYGAKNHTVNRNNINAALEKHSNDYKEAKALIENENKIDQDEKAYVEAVEDYTQRITYSRTSAEAISRAVDEIGDSEELTAQSAELTESISLYKNRLEALKIARNVLDEAYKRWQADLGPVFGNEAGIILGKLTKGRYNDMRVARNFEITLRSDEGGLQNSYAYSGATVDQMYLALRLALVKIISPAESMLPMILDDPFVQYDEKRRSCAYDVIKDFTDENHSQIIMTACGCGAFPESFNVTWLSF